MVSAKRRAAARKAARTRKRNAANKAAARKDLPQDENVVAELQNVDQHEEEQLQNVNQHEEEDDNLFFPFFYLNYRILVLPRNFRT